MSEKDELRKKLEAKKLEERFVSPEEIERNKRNEESRERETKKWQEKQKEERRRDDFYARCKNELRPIIEAIQELVFNGERSEITDKESGGWSYGNYSYSINFKFRFYELGPDPHGPGGGGEGSSKIIITVGLDRESNEPVIINLSNRKHVPGGLFRPAISEWSPKVTLDDPDWVEKVEDYLLEELKQKEVI